MNEQLIPADVIKKADKVLFITHLAIGDYAYLQTYFKAFSEKYPHLKIDLWIDEVRRTWCFWRWKHLKNYSIYDWVEKCSFFRKIYRQTYSPFGFKRSVHEAKSEKYSLIISLGVGGMNAHRYAALARSISPQGFIAGIQLPIKPQNFLKKRNYEKLDVVLPFNTRLDAQGGHITDLYARWFDKLVGLQVLPAQRAPFVNIPSEWITYAKLQFLKYGIDKNHQKFGRVFFINPFAKNKKRCMPLSQVAALITQIKQDDQWSDISFIINVVPEEYERVEDFFRQYSLNNVFLFTASANFFQLPAIMSCCDMIISVETSTIHLASALHVPVVALMRQKNPEWAPWDKQNSLIVTALQRNHWVKDIPVISIVHAVKQFSQKYF